MNVTKATNVEQVRHVVLEWGQECNTDAFGMTTDMDSYLANMRDLIVGDDTELLLLISDKGRVVGYMGVMMFFSPVGKQKWVAEHHLYIMADHRGSGALRLMIAAKDWAKEHGCTHLIMTASKLASDLHDKVCAFYKGVGMTHFETSYIQEII